jgi:predicted acetyltransferase
MRLVDPHPRFHRSFLAAADEFIAADEAMYANLLSWPADAGFPGIEFTRAALDDPEVFAELTDFLIAQRHPETARPRQFVPFTELWMAEGEEYVGRISVRHELNELLWSWGGHVGYAVRPSARGRGLAGSALTQMLEVCRTLGVDPVLITCDVDNEPSRRTIESAGGVYEDTREGKLRYWIDLA